MSRHAVRKCVPAGAIRALVGGRNFDKRKFNLATQAHRQTGSAAKPFTFLTAMRQHIDPNAVLNGPPDLVIPDPSLSLRQGAIAAWSRSQFFYPEMLEAVCEAAGIDMDRPAGRLT